MTAPRWDLVADDLTRYRASKAILGDVLGPVSTHMDDQSVASLRSDIVRHGIDPNDPVVVMALVYMVKRFATYVAMWVPAVHQTGAPIVLAIDALERALGGLLFELVPTESRPAE